MSRNNSLSVLSAGLGPSFRITGTKHACTTTTHKIRGTGPISIKDLQKIHPSSQNVYNMTSPFPPSTSAPGEGHLTTTLLPNGHSHLATITYQYPLKLISPPRSTQQHLSALVFLLSYGGGLVGGDTVSLHITVGHHSKLSVVTQGHTKIFRSAHPDITTRQQLDVVIEDGAALCLLPDPVQPFAESVYEQTQIFRLQGDGASLCLLDWVTQGRSARGENWDLLRWFGRNEVWWTPAPDAGASPPSVSAVSASAFASASASVESATDKDKDEDTDKRGRLLVRDAVKLDNRTPAPLPPLSHVVRNLKDTMHGTGLFGTLILRGPLVTALGAFFLAEFAALPRVGARDWESDEAKRDGGQNEAIAIDPHEAWREERLKLERNNKVFWSAANVRGCVVVKFGAATVEAGRVWIHSMLVKEGSVAEHFGDQALMCLR